MRIKVLRACFVLVFTAALLSSRPPDAQAANSPTRLDQDTLKLLVSGVACYPDALLTNILEASSHPLQLRKAAGLHVRRSALRQQTDPNDPNAKSNQDAVPSPAVEALKPYPDILQELTTHALLTTRLGMAYQSQPDDVWTAIRSVRAEVEKNAAADSNYTNAANVVTTTLLLNTNAVNSLTVALNESPVATTTTTTTTATGAATGANTTVTAGTSTSSGTYQTPAGTVTTSGQGAGATVQGENGTAGAAAGSKTVIGPEGNSATATGVGVAGKTTQGDTTTAGAAGAGTVTTSTGASVSGAGYAKGSVTKDGDTTGWSTDAAGVARNNNTGATGAATHSGSGEATQNGSSSTYSRSGTSSATLPDGTSASISKTGSGSADTAAGTATYSGSSDINTRSGSEVSTDTDLSYAKGEGVSGTTTATKDGETKTVDYGSGQAKNSSTASQKTMPKPSGTAPWQAQAKNGQFSSQDLAPATQSLHSGWGQVDSSAGKSAAKPSSGAKQGGGRSHGGGGRH